MANFKSIKDVMRDNVFMRNFYACDLSLEDFILSLSRYLNRALISDDHLNKVLTERDIATLRDIIFSKVPEFQRENNKWTEAMQSSFVWNVLKGYKKDPLCLYNVVADGKRSDYSNCWLLDGLQRTTALVAFLSNDLVVNTEFGSFTCKELVDAAEIGRLPISLNVGIRIFTFNSHQEACRHYIEMNEGITHSPEDIQKARIWLENNPE